MIVFCSFGHCRTGRVQRHEGAVYAVRGGIPSHLLNHGQKQVHHILQHSRTTKNILQCFQKKTCSSREYILQRQLQCKFKLVFLQHLAFFHRCAHWYETLVNNRTVSHIPQMLCENKSILNACQFTTDTYISNCAIVRCFATQKCDDPKKLAYIQPQECVFSSGHYFETQVTPKLGSTSVR